MTRALLLLCVVGSVCAGCGAGDRPDPSASPQATAKDTAKNTVFDDTIQAKERARTEAEKASAERKGNLDEAIKNSEGVQ